jgi:hypothetical protein
MNAPNRTSRNSQKQYEKKDKNQTAGRRRTTYRDPDSPPNDRIRKDPGEEYGDTKMTHSGSK